MFGTIPSGNYYIIPYYQGHNIYFQPEQIDFTIKHNSLQLDQHFGIVGFNVPGKVVRTRNVPVANAKIFLNGQEIMKTDANGRYKLKKIKAGTYKLRAQADDLIFEEILVRVNPSLQELPDILPSAFKVCGEVASDHSQIVTFSKVGSTQFIQTETSPHDGSFCQYLSPGQYQVQVLVSDEDKQKGLQFFPITQIIEVTSDKILNILFSQLKSTISGKVKCTKPKDCESLAVVLRTGNEKEVTLKVRDGSYTIDDMYPGIYDVILLPNKFCWKTNKQTINVNSAIVEVPPFIQRGYTVSFVSSHDTQVHFKTPGQTTVKRFDITKGRSSFCLENPGEYVFSLEGCHSYNPKTVSYHTDAEVNEILLTAQKHTLKLGIDAEADFGNIQVSVKIGTDKVERILKYNRGLYELDILLEPGENAVIIPQSETIFFNPPILSVEGREDCENVGVKFVAVRGRLFKGKVIPPLAGVTITVESTDSETLVVETDVNGIFNFPPLDNKKEYAISAKKESYVLSGPDKDGNFLAHKLAEVIVEVLDAADNSPLPGVLLSLSGRESYRRNLQSDENGKISFHSLSPSEYFLRPMMKEYQFEPNSKIILVNEGQTVRVKLIGKRVAYSAFGQVVSLNGEPEDNMIVIASGVGNCSHYSEETTCEPTGKFRIRGLQPYCSYRVIVKGSEDERYHVERTTPEFIEINSISEDIKDLKLIVFRPATQMDVLVKIYAENVEHYKSLKVKLIRETGSSIIVHTAKIDALSLKLTNDINPGVLLHIPSLPIDNRLYSIQLETNLAQNTRWKPQIHHFNANTSFEYIELDFNAKSSISEQPIKQTSIWSLIFILSIIFSLYNIELVANVLKDKFDFNISAITNLIPIPSASQKNATDYYDNAQIDQIVQSINAVKKKPKPKKA
uniref:Nodal modulator 3 n=1 Tax=Anoplophora glabripennis TaxID=217634 RepID=V5G516_ANOGL